MAFPERLETERLTLRRWELSDRGDFGAIWADPVVWDSLMPGREFAPTYGAIRFQHHLAHWDSHGFGLFAVIVDESQEIAGWVGPSYPDFVPELRQEVELGWTLRRPFWGYGLATEAARAARDACLEHLDVARLISLIGDQNHRSQKVAERLGMTRIDMVHVEGFHVDLEVYELRREGTTPASGVSGGY